MIHEEPLLETTVETFDRVIGINLRGSFLVGKGAIALMDGREGRVILTASDLAYLGRATFSPYVASKHAVLDLTRSWAKEFAPRILVNALCPGPIDTEMLGAASMSAEWRARSSTSRLPGSASRRRSPTWRRCSSPGRVAPTSPGRASASTAGASWHDPQPDPLAERRPLRRLRHLRHGRRQPDPHRASERRPQPRLRHLDAALRS